MKFTNNKKKYDFLKKGENYKYILLIFFMLFISIYLIYVLCQNKELFASNIDNKNKMKNYNVIFAGTTKNTELYIKNVLNYIDKCGEKFKSYIVIIYENDSDDKTRDILIENKKDNYYYIFEDNITEPRRTMRLENGRNKILEKVNEINNKGGYTYLIMLDMDDVNSSGNFINSIESCFNYDFDEWDMLGGNQKKEYYDVWALRKKGLLEYDFLGESNKTTSSNERKEEANHVVGNIFFEKNGLIDVDSAFGGISIYKLTSIKNCKYIGSYKNNEYPEIKNEKCEHVEFNECIKKNGGKLFINTEFYTN